MSFHPPGMSREECDKRDAEIARGEELQEQASGAGVVTESQAPEQEAPASPEPIFDKHIVITLGKDGMVSVRSKGVCTVEFFGMLHEADRITKQQIEIKEAMAMEAAMRQRQELEMVRAAIAHPAQPQPRK